MPTKRTGAEMSTYRSGQTRMERMGRRAALATRRDSVAPAASSRRGGWYVVPGTRYWDDGRACWNVHAPSGASMSTHETEADARREANRQNSEA
jgi:hypothetical protein